MHAERLAPAMAILPPFGPVGYMCDPREKPDGTADNTLYATNALPNHDALVEFTIWQYVLAPRILVNTTEIEPIIGNFHLPLPSLDGKGLRIEAKYPGGLCVLKKDK